MGDLIAEFERNERRRLRARWLMVGVASALAVFWLTGPYGVVLLVSGSLVGAVLVAVALIAALLGVLAFRASRRLVPASDFVIEADASEQADPAAAAPLASKGLGWILTFLNR